MTPYQKKLQFNPRKEVSLQPIDRIFVALDLTDLDKAMELSTQLCGIVGGVKLGKEFFTANGLLGAQKISTLGMPIFLDLKFHDIPNTVANAIKATLPLNPFLLNVHASGGRKMLEAAVDATKSCKSHQPLLIGVTILTSLGEMDIGEIGIGETVEKQVVRLSKLVMSAGLDGVVCSANEICKIRESCGEGFKLVVPGLRPRWASPDDQTRINTPSEAIKLGADYIVIGRPITAAVNPIDAAKRIADEVDQAKGLKRI